MRLGEPVPKGRKAEDFPHRIADLQCTTIKLSVLANPIQINDFSQAVNNISSAIEIIMKNSSTNNGQSSKVIERVGRGCSQERGCRYASDFGKDEKSRHK